MTTQENPLTTKPPGFATRAIHAGQEPDPATGAVTVPIYATSTYVQEEIGKHKGYEYARVSNPTRDRLETNLAALEGGTASRVFASGMAAINAIASMPPGDTALARLPFWLQPCLGACGRRSLSQRAATISTACSIRPAISRDSTGVCVPPRSSVQLAPSWPRASK